MWDRHRQKVNEDPNSEGYGKPTCVWRTEEGDVVDVEIWERCRNGRWEWYLSTTPCGTNAHFLRDVGAQRVLNPDHPFVSAGEEEQVCCCPRVELIRNIQEGNCEITAASQCDVESRQYQILALGNCVGETEGGEPEPISYVTAYDVNINKCYYYEGVNIGTVKCVTDHPYYSNSLEMYCDTDGMWEFVGYICDPVELEDLVCDEGWFPLYEGCSSEIEYPLCNDNSKEVTDCQNGIRCVKTCKVEGVRLSKEMECRGEDGSADCVEVEEEKGCTAPIDDSLHSHNDYYIKSDGKGCVRCNDGIWQSADISKCSGIKGCCKSDNNGNCYGDVVIGYCVSNIKGVFYPNDDSECSKCESDIS